MAAVG